VDQKFQINKKTSTLVEVIIEFSLRCTDENDYRVRVSADGKNVQYKRAWSLYPLLQRASFYKLVFIIGL